MCLLIAKFNLLLYCVFSWCGRPHTRWDVELIVVRRSEDWKKILTKISEHFWWCATMVQGEQYIHIVPVRSDPFTYHTHTHRGGFAGEQPYTSGGRACSACPSERPHCEKKLCSKC